MPFGELRKDPLTRETPLRTWTWLSTALVVAIAACSNDGSEDRPYVEFAGGGFVFNYRTAVVDYGFVVLVKRKLEPGTILEAIFENPAENKPIVIATPAVKGRIQYVFRTPPVQGVKANRDYQAVLRVIDLKTNQILATYTRTYRSNVDQELMPKAPLAVGPGYHKPSTTH